MKKSPCRGSQRGFTAIDLTIAMAVTGMALSVSINSLRSVTDRWHAKSAVNNIVSAIRAARAQAIVAASNTPMAFDAYRGRYVLVARSAPGNVVVDEMQGQLRRIAHLPPGVTFSGPYALLDPITLRAPDDPSLSAVVFDSRGRLENDQPGFIYLGHEEQDLYWRIYVNRAGTVKTQSWNGSSWI